MRGGKPCIKGTRITVGDVLEYLAGGMSEEQILADFPALKQEHIRACLAFAAARERRLADVNWSHGTLVTPKTPDEPVDLDKYGADVAALLDEAEDVINSVGPGILAEVRADQARSGGRLRKIFRRKR